MFTGVDKFWRKLMKRVEADPAALRQATATGVLDGLRQQNAVLAVVQKKVEEFLETKRQARSLTHLAPCLVRMSESCG